MSIDRKAENILQGITDTTIKSWLSTGLALRALEALAPSSPSGEIWTDLFSARLADIGKTISTGHIYKLRHTTDFLIRNAPHLEAEPESAPKFNHVEIAARLGRVDPAEGGRMLEEILSGRRVTHQKLMSWYNRHLEENTEQRSPRHLGWERRRDRMHQPDAPGHPPPKSDSAAELNAWEAGWAAAEQHFLKEIRGLRETIREQERRMRCAITRTEDGPA
jgi:hypothetical protein